MASAKSAPGAEAGVDGFKQDSKRSRKNSKSNGSSRTRIKPATYLLCVRNEGYAASLERRKLYPALTDESAAKHNLVRIVDESGEDYLYPTDYFIARRLPASVKLALRKAS